MAVKEIHKISGDSKHNDALRKLRLEVEMMRQAKHVSMPIHTPLRHGLTRLQPRIADLVTSQGWLDNISSVEIVIGLEEGNLEQLVVNNSFVLAHVQERCIHQMLEALDFLAVKGIVHRDVKALNILYSPCVVASAQTFDFRLADFGASTPNHAAFSFQGTQWTMAPEVLLLYPEHPHGNGVQQTTKVDVWSLFVSIAQARNVCNYRSRSLSSNRENLAAARDAAADPSMHAFRDMAIEDPTCRATAREMLTVNFNGEGTAERPGLASVQRDNHQLYREVQDVRSLRRSPRDHDTNRVTYCPSASYARTTNRRGQLSSHSVVR